MPIDAIFVVYVLLFILISGLTSFYFRKIREASRGYTKAKTVLDDIIFSFNKDIQRHEQKLREFEEENEKFSIENAQAIQELTLKIANTKLQLEDLGKLGGNISSNYENLKKKIEQIGAKQDEISKKIMELESSSKQIKISETTFEPAIQMRKGAALIPLTETELKILELLDTEGEKSSPEIKDRTKLTREHTARLMKSLYVRGFVERRTDKIPFTYFLSKETKGLIKTEKGTDLGH